MTIFYPDISSFQAGISLRGALAVACKVTEGTGYFNPDFNRARGSAASCGTFFFAYHFLSAGSAAAQARWCYSHAGKTPLMVDFEPSGSRPSLADCLAFIDAYRAMGGVVHLVYLPHWYWTQIGSPPLSGLVHRGISLVASEYSSYSDHGPGWGSYGGMTPTIWQYTDRVSFNGHSVDFNAFRGSGGSDAQTLAELKSIATTGLMPVKSAPKIKPDKAGNPIKGLRTKVDGARVTVSWDKSAHAKSYLVLVWHRGPRWGARRRTTAESSITFSGLRRYSKYRVSVMANPASLRARMGRRSRQNFHTQ